MEKVETLIGKIKIRTTELISENKRLKDENSHLNQRFTEMKSQLEEQSSKIKEQQDKLRDLENELNARGTDAVSTSDHKEIKNEIDGILKEIDQCLALINK